MRNPIPTFLLAPKRVVAYGLMATLLTSCAAPNRDANGPAGQADNPCQVSNNKVIGAAAGVAAGVAIGMLLGGKNKAIPALLGGLSGGAVGYLVGQGLDDRRCQQWKIAQANKVDIKFADVTLPVVDAKGQTAPQRVGQVAIWSGEQFQTGSAVLLPEAEKYFREVAATYTAAGAGKDQAAPDVVAARRQQRILLVGHTDDVGSSAFNEKLSEARAKAVGEVFRSAGVEPDRLLYQGAGEIYPIGDNRTDDGRAKNRRVEVVEIQNEQALGEFLRARQPQTNYYRQTPKPQVTTEASAGAPSPTASPKSGVAAAAPTTAAQAAPAQPQSSQPPAAASAPTTPPTALAPNPKVAAAKPATSSTGGAGAKAALIDFGGVPATNVSGVSADMIGGQQKGFTTTVASYLGISSAIASDSVFESSCLSDHARVNGDVKRLSDGSVFNYQTSEFVPGLYGTSYGAPVNGHLVGLTDVKVLRDGTKPVGSPTLMIFKNYKPSAKKDPDLKLETSVTVYPGNDALLYRVFAISAGGAGDPPLQCVDLIFPNQAPFGAKYGKLYYPNRGEAYVADFNPVIAR